MRPLRRSARKRDADALRQHEALDAMNAESDTAHASAGPTAVELAIRQVQALRTPPSGPAPGADPGPISHND